MRAHFRHIPLSLGWFALTGVIFLLQLFPFTGIFLMFVLAMFWSVFTINLGFLSLLIEVPVRRLSKAWLALPIAWFGGYAALAYLSHQRAAMLDQHMRAANAAQYVAFDADRQSLVFDSKSNQLSMAAHHFVQNYPLPVAYQTNAGNRGSTHRAVRVVADPLCQTVRTDTAFNSADVRVAPVYEGPGYFGRAVKGICVLTAPEEPGDPRVLVAARDEEHQEFFVPHTVTHMAIRDAHGNVARLAVGWAEPLYWFPLPVVGCALNSARASWPCMATFWRTKIALGGSSASNNAFGAIAAALALEKSPASERVEKIAAAGAPSVESILRTRLIQSLATLDDVIADPRRRINIFDVKGLAERPDVLGDRAPRIVEAIERVLNRGQVGYETARVLQGILAALPGSTFDAIGPALLAVFDAQPELSTETVEQVMASRLGRLGPAALPALERMVVAQRKRPVVPALYGLCRIGRDAAPLAERVGALASKESASREEETAIYAALMRMGRADIVEFEKALGRFTKIEKRVVDRAISPDSSPSACTDGSNRPRVLD